jgi:hypothetical protein
MISDDDIHTFTKGACYILADVISEMTGWPRCGFEAFSGYFTGHAFVRMPDGRYLDVLGIQAEDEIRKRYPWHANRKIITCPGTPEGDSRWGMWQLPWSFTEDEWFYHERARQIAPEILAGIKQVTLVLYRVDRM